MEERIKKLEADVLELKQHVRQAVSEAIGLSAEMARLKEYLGDSLPEDWESKRFAQVIG